MKYIILLQIGYILLSATNVTVNNVCTCQQLSQYDCSSNQTCIWNENQCQINNTTISNTIPIYCNNFLTQETCIIQLSCQWYNNECTPFTGCSPYLLKTDGECKMISQRCYKSNGVMCIQQSNCADYTSQNVCIMDSNGKYCYWDSTQQLCIIPETCSQLSSKLDTDSLCQAQINSCTTQAGGGCIDKQQLCTDYQLEIQCYSTSNGDKCFWDDIYKIGCLLKICENAPISYKTDAKCQEIQPTCTTKKNGGCITRTSCYAVLTKAACIVDNQGNQCMWVDQQCKLKNCINASKSIVTNIGCQLIDNTCITKSGGGCQTNGECSIATIDYACKTNIRGESCYWNNIANKCMDRTCLNASITFNTHDKCNKYLSTCTVNSNKQGCIEKSCENAPTIIITNQACQDYFNNTCVAKQNGGCMTITECNNFDNENACLIDNQGRQCFWYDNSCDLKTCSSIPKDDSITLTHEICNNFMQTCTINKNGDNCINYICENVQDQNICQNNNQCVWRTSCFIKNCYTAPLSYTTHQQCNNYLNNCTISNKGYGCSYIMNQCSQYQVQLQCLYSIEGKCVWQNNKCLKRICNYADSSYNSTDKCQQYLEGCVVNNKLNGCMNTITKCSDSLIEDNCLLSICEWKEQLCQTKTCQSQTTNCDTYITPIKCIQSENQCINVPDNCSDLPLSYCTPQQSNNLIQKYCYKDEYDDCNELILSDNCTNYNQEDICIKTINNIQCIWYNDECYNNQCQSLPDSITTFDICKQLNSNCILDNDDLGCREITKCNDYSINNCENVNTCIYWNNSCQIKSCSTTNYANHNDCYTFMKCTVNQTNNGCISLQNCNNYMTSQQCIINSELKQCIWINNYCYDKQCNQQTTSQTHEECQQYMNTCTLNLQTNLGCVAFSDCQSLQDQQSCSYFNQCQYIDNQCVIKTCFNQTLIQFSLLQVSCNNFSQDCIFDQQQCQTKSCQNYIYYNDQDCKAIQENCTSDGTKCVERYWCIDATTEIACVTDILGNKCQWITNKCYQRNCSTAPTSLISENECQQYYENCTTKQGGGCIIKSNCTNANVQSACTTSITGEKCVWDQELQICRNQQCKDYSGKTHSICNLINNKCTSNGLGKCTDMLNCNLYLTENECIIGYDGPCLWKDSQCYQYNQCNSVYLSTHEQCQQISQQCTTNGVNCTPITLCQLTNIQGGCVIGSDGQCIQTLSKDKSQTICKLFTSCNDGNYASHLECNNANSTCTTDGTQCISLLNCSDYNLQISCNIDKNGIQYSSQQKITSTGICIWENQICRSQNCTDLNGITYLECNNQLNNCTTDGIKCITLTKCANYSQNSCFYGTDGICIYIDDVCRVKVCNDIQTQSECTKTCVYDGSKCISKSTCSSYNTQTACDNGGTDGICVWSNSNCLLFNQCSQAVTQIYCNKQSLLCYWDNNTCQDMTCQQQYKQNGKCTYIKTWETNQINVCNLQENQCVSIDPSNLQQSTCYISSAYSYTFNSTIQKCQQCGYVDTNITTNNQNISTGYETILIMIFYWLLY